jgi:FMN reductase
MSVLTIAGSPARQSRSTALLEHLSELLEAWGIATRAVRLRDLPADDLIEGRIQSPAARIVRAKVDVAQAIIVATPVYKASLSGGLKALLDLLPENAFAGKTVLPVATGGSNAHLLVLEYGLKPVLSALGARHILSGIYATDEDVGFGEDGAIRIAAPLQERLQESAERLTEGLLRVDSLSSVRRLEIASGTERVRA